MNAVYKRSRSWRSCSAAGQQNFSQRFQECTWVALVCAGAHSHLSYAIGRTPVKRDGWYIHRSQERISIGEPFLAHADGDQEELGAVAVVSNGFSYAMPVLSACTPRQGGRA